MQMRKFLGMGAVLLILVILTSRPAQAHPIVVQTDPPDGSNLEVAPGQVRLFLNQPVLLDFTTIELVDGDGNHFSPLAILPDSENGPAKSSTPSQTANVLIKLPTLPPNTYRLTWKTRSEDDFHVSAGAVVFGVQRPVNETTATGPALPSWWEVSLRWLNFGAIAGVVGLLSFVFLVLRTSNRSGLNDQASSPLKTVAIEERLVVYARRAAWTALAAGGLFLGWQGVSDKLSGERWWELLTGTAFGQRWLAGEIILSLLLVLLYLGVKWRQAPLFKGIILVLVAGLAGTVSQNTHAGLPGSSGILNFLADSFHLLAACLWIGGLAGLLLMLGPALIAAKPLIDDSTGPVLRRFSKMAALSLLVLVVTGFYKGGQQIASLDGLLTTLYGQALLIKFQLVLFAALLGLFNTLLLHPRLRQALPFVASRTFFKPRFLKRALLVEISTLGLVLVFAAFLSASEPARGPEFEPGNAVTANNSSYSASVNDLIINFSVKPNRPGRNFLDLDIYNTRRPVPAAFDKVNLRLRSPRGQDTLVELAASGTGHFQLSGDQLQNAGNWQVEIAIERPNMPDSQVAFNWKVPTAQEIIFRRPVVFSNQPLQPWFNLAAGVVLLAGGIFWFGMRLRQKGFLTRPLAALLTLVAIRRN